MPDPTAVRPRLAGGLHGWRHPAILAATALSTFAGFAQFGATAALGDVARAFGEVVEADTVAGQVGLSGTTLGLGLALIRLASLASLPLSGAADHVGRRRILLWCSAGGLALTAVAALSPGFWWFVALFALGRPLLSATNAVAGVVAAEETPSSDRAKAMALIAAGYGLGAGLTALLRGVGGGAIGFRWLFALALVPLALVPLVGRRLEESERFTSVREAAQGGALSVRLGHIPQRLRSRLLLVAVLTFAVAFVTGPANGYLFVYAENVLGLSPAALALAVLAAGPIGLAGLLAGRWAADRLGRRVTAGATLVLVAVGGAVTYSGTPAAAVGGYLATVLTSSTYTPAAGSISAEVFPTSARAKAAGWLTVAGVSGAVAGLLAFGTLLDAMGAFRTAAILIAVPVALAAPLYALLPETRGRELEETAPEEPAAA